MRPILTVLVGCLLLGVVSCKQSQYKQAVVGKWECLTHPGLEFEFSADGKVNSAVYVGTYRLDGDDNLFITTNEPVGGHTKFRSKISIQHGILTLTDPDGSVLKFKKKRDSRPPN